jgi:hypothetical protein
LNSSAVDESELVHPLRNQISQLDKDMVGLHAMAALVKKKNEIATGVEQHALDRLRVATESLSCMQSTRFCFFVFLFVKNLLFTCFFPLSSKVVAFNESEENTRIHEKIAAMTVMSHPKCALWSNRSKAVIVVKFEYRVEKVHYYFDKYHARLNMVWRTMFPLDPAPETLSALFSRFKTPAIIRYLVRKELLAGAELAFASALACHPTLELEFVANANVKLD